MSEYRAPHSDVVMLTRVHLLRNFADVPFDAGMTHEQAQANISRVSAALEAARHGDVFDLTRLNELTPAYQKRLLAHHLITASLVDRAERGAAFISKGSTLSVMVNDEDHVNIMGLMPGLNVEHAASLCCQADEWLDAVGAYACDDQFGYLTCDPSHAGSGMTAEVLMHLPGLAAKKQIAPFNKEHAPQGISLKPRREGKDSAGGVYTLRGCAPMGVTEESFLETFNEAASSLAARERDTLRTAVSRDSLFMEDQTGRCLAVIRAAKLMSEGEMLQRCSQLRSAAAADMLPAACQDIDRIAMDMRDACIDALLDHQPTDRERDLARAALLRHAVNRLLEQT